MMLYFSDLRAKVIKSSELLSFYQKKCGSQRNFPYNGYVPYFLVEQLHDRCTSTDRFVYKRLPAIVHESVPLIVTARGFAFSSGERGLVIPPAAP